MAMLICLHRVWHTNYERWFLFLRFRVLFIEVQLKAFVTSFKKRSICFAFTRESESARHFTLKINGAHLAMAVLVSFTVTLLSFNSGNQSE